LNDRAYLFEGSNSSRMLAAFFEDPGWAMFRYESRRALTSRYLRSWSRFVGDFTFCGDCFTSFFEGLAEGDSGFLIF